MVVMFWLWMSSHLFEVLWLLLKFFAVMTVATSQFSSVSSFGTIQLSFFIPSFPLATLLLLDFIILLMVRTMPHSFEFLIKPFEMFFDQLMSFMGFMCQ